MNRHGRRAAVPWLGLLAALVLAQAAAAAEAPRERPGRAGPPALTVGQAATDFELPRLAFDKNDSGETVGKVSRDTVKLSTLVGKRPICLFLSSYT